MLRYTVRPETVDEQVQLLRAVYEELDQRLPEDFGFVTYQLEGVGEFLDVAVAPRLPGPLPDMASFRRYRAGLDQRCSDRIASELELIGAYRPLDLATVRSVVRDA